MKNLSFFENRLPQFASEKDFVIWFKHIIKCKRSNPDFRITRDQVATAILDSQIRAQNKFIAGALENAFIQATIEEGYYEEDLFKKPYHTPVITHFEHAIVYGAVREAFNLRKFRSKFGKTRWGDLQSIEPYEKDTPWDRRQVLWVMKDSNVIYQRQITRNEYRALVGSSAVYYAMRSSKKVFLNETIEPRWIDDLKRIGLTPEQFWRNVRNGNVGHIKALDDQGKLAPEKKVSGKSKWKRRRRQLSLFENF